MFDSMTNDTRRVLVLASDNARLLKRDAVGVEHLLLALVDTAEGELIEVLFALNVSARDVWMQTQLIAGSGTVEPPGQHLPWTSGAKAVLRHTVKESKRLGLNCIAPKHLLLGLATSLDDPWEEPEIAGEIMDRLHLKPRLLRKELLSRLGSDWRALLDFPPADR